ncbi:phosphate propanoyltransferase [Clostridium sp. D33t1_170424_F3]|uniref:phosphate propanoyltransferase n=1 Tax=Clostridium sp. D33t1_170424_F3 TaxID=2787099 RepID=UPI0018AAA608|nr:phosphate propanoyltransferase [Clostridium sp. D33t1_170424_F3]
MKIMVETSARHVHLTQEDLDTLFGKGYELTPKKALSQPGQFACEEKVEVVGPRGSLKMSILGPIRPETQVEVAKTDARALGIDAPLRMSADLEGTPGCKIIGPKAEITIDQGVIVAKRHAHFPPDDAVAFGVTDGEAIQIKLGYNGRSLILGDVIARVSKTAGLAVHIDTDEANAAGLTGTVDGEVIVG